MSSKSKTYINVKFSPEVIKKALLLASQITNKVEPWEKSYHIKTTDDVWYYDQEEEFFSKYRDEKIKVARIRKSFHEKNLFVSITLQYAHFYPNGTELEVAANDHKTIHQIFEIFEDALKDSKIPNSTLAEISNPTIFIGHGQSKQWIELRDHLRDLHKYRVIFFEEEPRAGDNIADILEDMAERAFMAFLVHTGEDTDKMDILHARENVIHETGFFQASLGFNRAIVLLEKGCKEFSNISGIQQIRFSKGNIKEAFGEILATIKREVENDSKTEIE